MSFVRSVRLLGAALVTAAAATVCATPSASAFTTTSGVRLNAFEARMVALINYARTSRGIPALVVAPGTTDVARRWSANQASRNSMYHNGNLARDVQAAGSSNWSRLAENVGMGSGTNPDMMFNAYMNSTGHRNNILNSAYRYLGIAWAERANGSGFNTQVFVNQYSTSYGRNRQPAFGGLLDKRTFTTTAGFADFESGWDSRAVLTTTASGMWSGFLVFEQPATGDQAARFQVRQTAGGSGGAGEMRLRDAVDLSRATALDVRIGANTGTGRPIAVDIYVRREWGDAVRVGTVTVPSGRNVSARFTLPAAARGFRNVVAVSVSRSALSTLDSSSLSGRWANVYVRNLAVVV